MAASAQTQPDAFVLDTSALLRLHLVDTALTPSLALAMQRGCRGDALLMEQMQRQLVSTDECLSLLADFLQLPPHPTAPANWL